MQKRAYLPVILIMVMSMLVVPVSALAITASGVTLNFMCGCGTCTETLTACECPQSDEYRAQITKMVAQGWSENQIIEDFVNRFGESVLVVNAGAAPKSYGGGSGAVAKTYGSKSNSVAIFLIGFGMAAFLFAGFRLMQNSRERGRSNSRSSKNNRRSSARNRKRSRQGSRRREKDRVILDDDDYE